MLGELAKASGDDDESVDEGATEKAKLARKATGVERMRERIMITSTEKNEVTWKLISKNIGSPEGRSRLAVLLLQKWTGISKSEPQKGIDGSRIIHPSSPMHTVPSSLLP